MESIMNNIKSKAGYILLFLVGGMILCSISYNLWHSDIATKTETTYKIDTGSYETEEISEGTYTNQNTVLDSKILKYVVCVNKVQKYEGNIQAVICDEAGNQVEYAGDINDYLEKNKLVFDVSSLTFSKGSVLTANLTFDLNKPIQLSIDKNGNIQDEAVYEYYYSHIFKIILVLLILIYIVLGVIGFVHTFAVETKFLILAMTFGALMVIVAPPFTAPDEFRHFARAYDITNGNFKITDTETRDEFWGGYTLPVGTISEDLFELKLLSEKNNSSFTSENNHALISMPAYINALSGSTDASNTSVGLYATNSINPIAYLPQVIMIGIGRLLSIHGIYLYYLARLGNAVFGVLLVWLAIKLTPRYKEISCVVGMIPTTLFQRSSNSTDGLLLGLTMLAVAYIFIIREKREKVQRRDYIVLLILSIWISLIKLPYVLILLMLFTVNKRSFGDSKWKKVISIGMTLLSGIAIYGISNRLLHIEYATPGYTIPAKEMIINFMHNIVQQSAILIRGFYEITISSFMDLFSWPLGLTISGWALLIFVYIVFRCSKGQDNGRNVKVISGILFLLCWCAIIAVFYLARAESTAGITGIQGRYLAPLMLPLGIAFASGTETSEKVKCNSFIIYTIISMCYILEVIGYFWV